MTALIVLALLSTVVAHNYVNSPSRAGDGTRSEKASTFKPAPPSTGVPQVVIGRDQEFQMEWVVGHNRFTYLTLLAKKDEGKLNGITTKELDDYLNNGPDSNKPPPLRYRKYHRKHNGNLDYAGHKGKGFRSNFWQRSVPKSDSAYVTRDAIFKGAFEANGQHAFKIRPNDVFQMQYKDADHRNDRWTQYKNDKYPWILGSSRYSHVTHIPFRPDFTMVKFPPGTPNGYYVVQYQWSGYYDAIDVLIVNDRVANPYGAELPPGAPDPNPSFARIDHCWYPEAALQGDCFFLGKEMDVSDCRAACAAKPYTECDGVGIVPITAGPAVFSGFKDVSVVPWGQRNCNKGSANGATHVCYPVKKRAGSALEFPHYTSNDVEDPAFYATCLNRDKPSARGGANLSPNFEPPAWEYFGKCVDCTDRVIYSDGAVIPQWSLKSECKNCDRLEIGEVDPRLAVYLTFDDAGDSGNRIKNNARYSVDVEPIARDFRKNGNVAIVNNGKVGKAAKFGGNAGDNINLEQTSVTGRRLSACAWANFESTNGEPRILSKTFNPEKRRHIFALFVGEDRKMYWRVKRGVKDADVKDVRTNDNVRTNEWHHWCGTYDGAKIILYRDGKKINENADVIGAVPSSSGRLYVGCGSREGGSPERPMRGMLDDVRIYKATLSQLDILSIMEWTGSSFIVHPKPATPATPPAMVKLMHHFKLDATSGNSVLDSVTNQNYQKSGDTQWVDAKYGKGLKFGGNDGDYVDVGNWNLAQTFSITAWAFFTRIDSADPRIISKATGPDWTEHVFAFTTDEKNGDGKFYPRVRTRVLADNSVTEAYAIEDGLLKDNTWQHWGATYDGKQVKLYIDGVLKSTVDAVGAQKTDSDARVLLGASPTGNGNRRSPMQGTIDDVRVYEGAMSAAQMRNAMNNQ